MGRKNIPKKIQLEVWKRDSWHCRYCGKPVFFSPTLKLLDQINPNHTYYHKNGKTGKMLELFQKMWASVDHIVPISKGGENEIDNYATACWKCNLKFREKMVGKDKSNPLDPEAKEWDGFSGLYPSLIRLTEQKENEWVKLIKK